VKTARRRAELPGGVDSRLGLVSDQEGGEVTLALAPAQEGRAVCRWDQARSRVVFVLQESECSNLTRVSGEAPPSVQAEDEGSTRRLHAPGTVAVGEGADGVDPEAVALLKLMRRGCVTLVSRQGGTSGRASARRQALSDLGA